MLESYTKLATKGPEVNIQFLCPELVKAFPVLRIAFAVFMGSAVITSGNDGKHSGGSAHYKDRGIDLRTLDLAFANLSVGVFKKPMSVAMRYEMLAWFGERIADLLKRFVGDGYYVVLEKDHFHLEHAFERPNIKGWTTGKMFYMNEAVREIIAARYDGK